jgi:hypothetical protein
MLKIDSLKVDEIDGSNDIPDNKLAELDTDVMKKDVGDEDIIDIENNDENINKNDVKSRNGEYEDYFMNNYEEDDVQIIDNPEQNEDDDYVIDLENFKSAPEPPQYNDYLYSYDSSTLKSSSYETHSGIFSPSPPSLPEEEEIEDTENPTSKYDVELIRKLTAQRTDYLKKLIKKKFGEEVEQSVTNRFLLFILSKLYVF